jgi:hypothetical protein
VRIFLKTSGPEVDPPVQEVSVSNDYVMIGGGAQVHWNGPGILLFESYPMDKTTWRAKAKAHFHPDRGTITTYAIGLKCNVAGVTIQSDIAMAKSSASGSPQATVAPPRGYRMVGGGSQIAFNGPGVLLYASYPNENNQWEGRGNDHQGPDKGTLSVYCIGLKVET